MAVQLPSPIPQDKIGETHVWREWFKTIREFVVAKNIPRFSQTAIVTVANTTTETSLIGTGQGSITLPANVLTAGSVIKLKASGFYTTKSAPGNWTFNIKIGGTTLLSLTNAANNNISSPLYWSLNDCIFTVYTTGTSGTIIGQGAINESLTHLTNVFDDFVPMTTTGAINTTITNKVDFTITWSSASATNSFSCTNVLLELFII